MNSFNIYLFTLINQGAGQWPLLDGFFVWLTSYIAWGGVILVLLYVCMLPFRTADPLARVRRMGEAAEIALSMFITWAIDTTIKVLVASPRPFVTLTHIKQLVAAAPYQSFPSSHAALTMALAIAVLPYHKHLGHALIAFSLVVAMSRMFVGVHYPFDVGVGLAIGFLVSKAIHRVFAK